MDETELITGCVGLIMDMALGDARAKDAWEHPPQTEVKRFRREIAEVSSHGDKVLEAAKARARIDRNIFLTAAAPHSICKTVH